MREIITLTEALAAADSETMPTPAIVETPAIAVPRPILEELSDVVFKLRAFTESADGDLGLGVELGMQRAADMIDHIIQRHSVIVAETNNG